MPHVGLRNILPLRLSRQRRYFPLHEYSQGVDKLSSEITVPVLRMTCFYSRISGYFTSADNTVAFPLEMLFRCGAPHGCASLFLFSKSLPLIRTPSEAMARYQSFSGSYREKSAGLIIVKPAQETLRARKISTINLFIFTILILHPTDVSFPVPPGPSSNETAEEWKNVFPDLP